MSNGFKRTKSFILDFLTFSYPKYRIITIIIILLILLITPLSVFDSFPNLSICSHLLGKYCYSVGITRGLSSLLKGDLAQAINYNFLSIPVLIVLMSIIFYDLFKLRISQSRKSTRFTLFIPPPNVEL